MAQLVVRNLEEDVKTRLKERALRNGRSMEEEIRLILSKAGGEPDPENGIAGLGSRIAALFSDAGLEGDLPELTKQDIRPMKLGR